MMSVISLLCLTIVGAPLALAYNVSDKASYLYTFFNGELNNGRQNGTGRNFIQVRMVPVKAPQLSEYGVVFAEEVVDEAIMIFQVGIFEDRPGNRLVLRLYNFTDYSNIKPLTYDPKKVADLKPADLVTDDDCYAPFDIVLPNLLNGTFPDCKYIVDGKHPRFELFFDCQHENATFPKTTNQLYSDTPYVLNPSAPRYPLVVPSPGFVSPCEDYVIV